MHSAGLIATASGEALSGDLLSVTRSWMSVLYFAAEGQFSTAMKFYLEAGVVATDFFSTPVPRSLYDDQVCQKVLRVVYLDHRCHVICVMR